MSTFSPTRLRTRREALDISQRQLSARIGRASNLVGMFESGTTLPSIASIGALARELHCTVDDLFDGDGDAELPPRGTPDVPTELGPDVDEWVSRMLATAPKRIPEDTARRISAAMFGRSVQGGAA